MPCVVGPQTDEGLAAIEARAEAIGAPLLIAGRDWEARAENGRLVYRDEAGLLDLAPPILPGAHQFQNAGAAIAALRALGLGEDACAAAAGRAEWPARLQRLRKGALAEIAAAGGVELWLDGGHNLAAGEVIARHFADLHDRSPAPLALVCGMLDTKDCAGFLRCFAGLARGARTLDIPDTQASTPAARLAAIATEAGVAAQPCADAGQAVREAVALAGPGGRVLICGSLYLAGSILRANG